MTNEEVIRNVKTAFEWWEDNARMEEDEDWSRQHEALDMAIKALEQQPCEDCISRAEALNHSHIEYDDDGEGHRVVYVEDIEELPSVTPKGVTITDFADRCRECGKQKVGKWEELGIVMEGRMYEHGECDMQDAWGCDYCGYQVHMPTKYCPNCGSYNGGEKDGSD